MAAEEGGPSDALEAALTDVVAVLVRAGIPYALIGGLATGYRSRPRYTSDIDLILDIPQIALPGVLDALGGYVKYRRHDAAARSSSRKSGWAISTSSRARSPSDRPWRFTAPNSVTTQWT
jgi:hypothetical protein